MSDGDHFGTLRSIVHERARPRHMRMGELDRTLQDLPTPHAREDALRYVCEAWRVDEEALETLRLAHACSVALALDILAQPDVPHALAIYDMEDALTLEEIRGWTVDVSGAAAFERSQAHLRWRDPAEGRLARHDLITLLTTLRPALSARDLEAWSDTSLRWRLGPPNALIAEAPSLLALLLGLRAAGLLCMWSRPPRDLEALPAAAARFAEIADLEARAVALELWGGLDHMEQGASQDESRYCCWVEAFYPGWALVRCWDAVPPRVEDGHCILRRVIAGPTPPSRLL